MAFNTEYKSGGALALHVSVSSVVDSYIGNTSAAGGYAVEVAGGWSFYGRNNTCRDVPGCISTMVGSLISVLPIEARDKCYKRSRWGARAGAANRAYRGC